MIRVENQSDKLKMGNCPEVMIHIHVYMYIP